MFALALVKARTGAALDNRYLRPRDPIEQADILAIKAELIARIADQRAQQ